MKIGQILTQSQKLSPQQIQYIKLLQVSTMELDTRVKEELAENPVLEEGREESSDELDGQSSQEEYEESEYNEKDGYEDLDISPYMNDDYQGYKMEGDGPSNEDDKEMPIAATQTTSDYLLDQFGYLNLSEREQAIGMQLIGSIESDGYIRRDLEAIINDLAFAANIHSNLEEIEKVLKLIQQFDPPGIACRDLQECLCLQLARKAQTPPVVTAKKILMLCFEEFKKKHYHKIQKKLGITEDEIRDAVDVVIKLNPKPGGSTNALTRAEQYLVPDFILKKVHDKLQVSLHGKNAPELRISRNYAEMLDTYDKSKKKDKNIRQTITFVKQKLDSAKWFIDAIKQRQETLLKTMRAIVNYQYDFFITGDEGKLRPMILKDIAQAIDMDISTISRVANSKAVQTDFGLFPLKYFFSESISTESGEDVSSKEVKHILKSFIDEEDKLRPLSDDKLEKMLKDKGYLIARRTVAKYRENMGIPVARLRKEL